MDEVDKSSDNCYAPSSQLPQNLLARYSIAVQMRQLLR
jgi:hypothetical protein